MRDVVGQLAVIISRQVHQIHLEGFGQPERDLLGFLFTHRRSGIKRPARRVPDWRSITGPHEPGNGGGGKGGQRLTHRIGSSHKRFSERAGHENHTTQQRGPHHATGSAQPCLAVCAARHYSDDPFVRRDKDCATRLIARRNERSHGARRRRYSASDQGAGTSRDAMGDASSVARNALQYRSTRESSRSLRLTCSIRSGSIVHTARFALITSKKRPDAGCGIGGVISGDLFLAVLSNRGGITGSSGVNIWPHCSDIHQPRTGHAGLSPLRNSARSYLKKLRCLRGSAQLFNDHFRIHARYLSRLSFLCQRTKQKCF